MAAPNTQVTEHPIGGGQSPAYVGGPGGLVGFFQDPYGAVFQATASGTTLTVLSLTQGTIVVGQTITSINGVGQSGVTITAGLITGLLCWFGFVLTTLVTNHAYGKAKPMLTVIDGGHWLGVLLLQGLVLGWLG